MLAPSFVTVRLSPRATGAPTTNVFGQPVPDQTSGVGARVVATVGDVVGGVTTAVPCKSKDDEELGGLESFYVLEMKMRGKTHRALGVFLCPCKISMFATGCISDIAAPNIRRTDEIVGTCSGDTTRLLPSSDANGRHFAGSPGNWSSDCDHL
jgi:hypothetical protein